MDETRENMAVFKVEVVMGTVHIGWDHRGELTAMLFVVSPENKQ